MLKAFVFHAEVGVLAVQHMCWMNCMCDATGINVLRHVATIKAFFMIFILFQMYIRGDDLILMKSNIKHDYFHDR